MNTRIRYNKNDNILDSKENYKIRGSDYTVTIFTDVMKFDINKITTGQNPIVYLTGEGKTVNELKIKAKKALQELGIEFKSEYRSKKVTEI